jgi:hypothetical protein
LAFFEGIVFESLDRNQRPKGCQALSPQRISKYDFLIGARLIERPSRGSIRNLWSEPADLLSDAIGPIELLVRLHARERFNLIIDVVGASDSSRHADERHQKKLSHSTKPPSFSAVTFPKVTLECKAALVGGLVFEVPKRTSESASLTAPHRQFRTRRRADIRRLR